jgi:3-deoxy-7-phosphoheptulonate synthase
MIEVHNHPEEALSDGGQSLYPDQFEQTMKKLTDIRSVIESS